MEGITPTKRLKGLMDKYYNSSSGYLNHLNKKRGGYFNYYTYFLGKYLAQSKSASRVLELGCGDGYTTFLLSRKYPKLSFLGTDVSNKFISYARGHFSRKNLVYKVADSLSLPFNTRSIDVVTSTDVIEHIPDVPKWLDESIRVLKRGGLLIIVTGNHFSPIQPLLDIIRFQKRPPLAPTYFSQFKLFFYSLFMSFKKMLFPSFIYVGPELTSKADNGGDFDAVYLANQFDIIDYLKKRNLKILNIGFKGPDWFSKFCGTFLPFFSGMGIVARKPS